jgi:hypothetical protein
LPKERPRQYWNLLDQLATALTKDSPAELGSLLRQLLALSPPAIGQGRCGR